MKHLAVTLLLLAAHPGLPPSLPESALSTETSNETSVYSDIYSRGTSINTKYGTAMTADEIKEATQNRRANRDIESEGGPSRPYSE